MPVTQEMIQELIDCKLKDIPGLVLTEEQFKRQGERARLNAMASIVSPQALRYEDRQFHELIDEAISIYQSLKAVNVSVDDQTMGEHAWLAKYLPMLETTLSYLVNKHIEQYLYTDRSEIYLQSIAVIMLTYHSNPGLFLSNRSQYEQLLDAWLKALLQLNCIPLEEMIGIQPDWDNDTSHSSTRNLSWILIATPQYLRISQMFSGMLRADKWHKRVIAFDNINRAIAFVVTDYDIVKTAKLLAAVKHLHTMQENINEIQSMPALPPYSSVEIVSQLDQPSDLATQADNVLPVYLSNEQQARQDLGLQLIQQGVAALHVANSVMSHADEDGDIFDENEEMGAESVAAIQTAVVSQIGLFGIHGQSHANTDNPVDAPCRLM